MSRRAALRAVAVFMLLTFPMHVAPAQPGRIDLEAIRKALFHQLLFPRDFNAAPAIAWRWTGASFEEDPPLARQLSAMDIRDVKIRDSALTIVGYRKLPYRTAGQLEFYNTGERIEIKADLRDADAVSIARLPATLFYLTTAEALRALDVARPNYKPSPPRPPSFFKSAPQIPCTTNTGGQSTGTLPRPLSRGEPPHLFGFKGTLEVELKVPLNGVPADLWIEGQTSGGAGWDTAMIIREYRFTPATCGGEPVAMDITISTTVSDGLGAP